MPLRVEALFRVALRCFLAALAMPLALAACVSAPPQPQAAAPLTSAQVGLGAASFAAPAENWWEAYGDAQLNQLVQQALAHNPSLAQALARVSTAQALAAGAQAASLPSISFDAQETRERMSGTDIIPPPYAGTVQWEGHQGLQLSWDLDFWGRQSALLQQARSQAAAAQLDVAGARLALSGAVAHAYLELDRNHALAELAQKTEEQRTRILEIVRQRVGAGLDTNVELREAEGAVPQAQLDRLQAQAEVDLAVHQLAALAGRGADAYAQIQRPTVNLETALPLPAALPADLLGRRPDLLAARDRIEAATEGQAAAKAAFYPDVNLAAFVGTAAIGFSRLFESPSQTYGVSPAIHLPLFEAGRLKAQYRGASAEIDAAVAAYNGAVLQAVRQVSDQLSLIASLGEQLARQQQVLSAAEDAYRLAGERYQAGLSTYLTVLNAETQVINARRQRVDLVAQQAAARVGLLLALGGSFPPEPAGAKQTEPISSGVSP